MEATCMGIARLLAQGATLGDVEAYVEAQTAGKSEEELSAAWLRDWLALEHPTAHERPDLEPLD